jgi:hypothetical protein
MQPKTSKLFLPSIHLSMRVLDESYSRKVLCAQKLDTYVSNTIQCTNTKYVWIQLCIPKGQSKMDNPDKLAT